MLSEISPDWRIYGDALEMPVWMLVFYKFKEKGCLNTCLIRVKTARWIFLRIY
jgi:hypothetical protein